MLNPFFLQGSQSEQNLVQDLINEQLRMYGVECYYIPRRILTKKTIIQEVIQSVFDQAFPLETYIANFEGPSGVDILTKFGIRATDEFNLIISRERFESYITPFLKDAQEDYELTRPKEGDLIYLPLGEKLLEIKFVEHEKPFYQLQKGYVYELRCELFEYEDEVIDTGIDELDTVVQTEGYITRLVMSGVGSTATASTGVVYNAVQKLYLQSDGYGYSSAPTVSISTSPGVNATAVAIMTERSGIATGFSINRILLINPGSGYLGIPTVSVPGSGIATAGITSLGAVGIVTMTSGGSGYTTTPPVTFSPPLSGTTATGEAILGAGGTISAIYISNAGSGYTVAPTITVGAATTIGIGTYTFNEKLLFASGVGAASTQTARVKAWDAASRTLDVSSISSLAFKVGDKVTGLDSGAIYIIKSIDTDKPTGFATALNLTTRQYQENKEIETEADALIDFSERNPFGTF
jgi:hypothetical protein